MTPTNKQSTAKGDAQRLKEETKRDAAKLKNEVKRDAADLKETAKDRADEEARRGKKRAATEIDSVSKALHSAQDALDGEDTRTANLVQQGVAKAAEAVDELSRNLKDKEPAEIYREVQGFARRSPMMFIAGCTAVGFAASRVLQAGASGSVGMDRQSSGSGATRSTTGGTTTTTRIGTSATPGGSTTSPTSRATASGIKPKPGGGTSYGAATTAGRKKS